MKELYNTKIDKIANDLSDYLGIDIFENTRKRDYSDGRSCLIKVARDEYQMGWTQIAKYLTSKGKLTKSHASIIHSYKNFSTVLKNNHQIESAYDRIISENLFEKSTLNVIDRIRQLENPKKFSVIEKCLDTMGI